VIFHSYVSLPEGNQYLYTGYAREIQAAQQLLVILWRPIGAEVLPRGRGAAFRGSAAALCRLAPGEEQHADVVT